VLSAACSFRDDAPAATEAPAGITSDTTSETTVATTEVTVGDGDASTGNAGDFGTLSGVCGPGDATGTTARGVTDTTITVGTGADVQNPFLPGLGAGFFAAADAFAEWCNAAGGINGREIVVNKHDGGLFNAGAAVVAACETDFMLVGNGFAQDDQTPEPRLACDLGQIPAYQNSAAASASGLQVQPLPIPLDEWFVGGYRAVEAKYPGSLAAAGILGSAVPTVERNNTGAAAGIESLGGTVVDVQRVPPGNVDNWRPYAEALKQAGVTFLVPGAAAIGAMSPFGQAMDAAGFEPAAMVLDSSAYKPVNYLALDDADLPPFYLAIQFWPESLADRSPATAQAIEMLAAVDSEATYDFEYVQGLNAWILWAVAASACGSDLTTECVLEQAGSQQGWTAGGLVPPSDLSATELNMNTCFLIVQATPQGWVYDEEMTAPNTDAFNCSPDNVATVDI
jgi:ABC-type branched-subunit amino acid transport system substrate-binding protein